MILPFMVSQAVSAEMLMTKAAPAVIKNISDVNISLTQNEKFIFPSKVKAQLTDGKITEVAAKWDKKSIATDKTGVFVSYGTVKGYSKKVKLTLSVSASIKSLNDVSISARQGGIVTLPNTISANLSDGLKKNVDVIWSKKVDTSKAGTFVIEGTVKGFTSKAKAIVKVGPKIIVVNQLEVKVALGSDYKLPSKVEAVMADNSKEFVEVKWNKQKVDTANVTTTIIEGTINGYDSKVYLVVNVIQKTVQDVAKESNKILLLYIYDKNGFKIASGSGFIVSEDGKVLTNFHVVDGASKIKAVNNNGEYIDIKGIYYYSKEQDIALLQLDTNSKLPYVKLGDSDSIEQGDSIVAIGSPKGLQNSLSEGIISSLRKDIRSGYSDIQISAAISPGSSGGALFNMNGEVIGITYAKANGGENINFAIPINEAKAILNKTNTLSPISTIEKYNKEAAYEGFENYLTEKYDYFWVNDTKINIDSFDVYESKDGKYLSIYMNIYDDDNHYADYQKVMKGGTPKQVEDAKIAIQNWIYLPLNESKKFFPEKDLYLALSTVVLLDEEPSSTDWEYAEYNTKYKKWVCSNTEAICTERDNEYIFKWIRKY
jgi:S1-C subfamily serine protease